MPSEETCANCHRSIGALEEAFVWKDNIVCRECCSSLSNAPDDSNKVFVAGQGPQTDSPPRQLRSNHFARLQHVGLVVMIIGGVIRFHAFMDSCYANKSAVNLARIYSQSYGSWATKKLEDVGRWRDKEHDKSDRTAMAGFIVGLVGIGIYAISATRWNLLEEELGKEKDPEVRQRLQALEGIEKIIEHFFEGKQGVEPPNRRNILCYIFILVLYCVAIWFIAWLLGTV